MKTELFAAALSSLLLGVIIGATVTATHKRAALSDDCAGRTELLSLLPNGENREKAEWSELRKSDWHVAVVWVDDPSKKESRVYAYRKNTGGTWVKLDEVRLSYRQDPFFRVNYVEILYEDRGAMLINDQGLLIQSIVLGEDGDRSAEAK